MNGGAVNFDRSKPLFNLDVAGCRRAGRRGGLAHARNLRARKSAQAQSPVQPVVLPHEETAAEAIARIDALCPWLIGCERSAGQKSA
jgi:hypothetical protein